VKQALHYAIARRGLLASVGAPMRAFVRSRPGLEAPDLLLGWVTMFTEPGPKGPNIARQSGISCYAHPMRPESKGTIHITSADPRKPPAITFNFLSAPVDAELTVKAIRIARSIMTAPAMKALQVTEQKPGPERQSDEAIIEWVKAAGETTYHPVGTCKMGNDPMAGGRCRACACTASRACASPTLDHADAHRPGNTNAPSIMIGEKAADMVLADHR
jgi:choline dehydrogenase